MAAGGGGAWKVAYADFVTAMMAFFLVMWICAQDQKIKEAVAHYFTDPFGSTPIGSSHKGSTAGAVAETIGNGTVPKAQATSVGRGRNAYTNPTEGTSNPTKIVSDWIFNNDKQRAYWKEKARLQRLAAANSLEVRKKQRTVDEVAQDQLAKQLRLEISQSFTNLKNDLHQDLLFDILPEVNWLELAHDLLTN